VVRTFVYWFIPEEGEPVLMIEIDDESRWGTPEETDVKIRIRRNDGLMYEGHRADQDNKPDAPDEPQVYWDMAQDGDDENRPYGEDTARIIDLQAGGVIAYCHKDRADKMVRALWVGYPGAVQG
jgi:hypothetical protein